MGFLTKFVESFFFHADNLQYWKPEHYGLRSVEFKAEKSNGNLIDGIVLLPKKQDKKNIILYFNPAYFNREYCLPQVAFLALAGFPVVLFDYSGCGISDGRASLSSLLSDSEAVLGWLDNSEFRSEAYTVFAQGLGADAAMQLFNTHPKRVNGLILESAYNSRKGWVKDRWGPIIGDIAAQSLNEADFSLGDALKNARVPVSLIFPTADTHIRKTERFKLIANAPKRTLIWEPKNMRFLGVFGAQRNEWHDEMIHFIENLAK